MGISTSTLNINRKKLLNAFPQDIEHDVEIVADFLSDKNFDIHPTSSQKIILDQKELIIPGRVYFHDPDETIGKNLTYKQQTILNCIYLRHYNGLVRQHRLEKLIHNTDDYFVIPYIFQLLGEYVIEILTIADKHINEKTIKNYLKFFNENSQYRHQTESRMISYWNAYYRKNVKNQKDYIGSKIFNRLKMIERKTLLK